MLDSLDVLLMGRPYSKFFLTWYICELCKCETYTRAKDMPNGKAYEDEVQLRLFRTQDQKLLVVGDDRQANIDVPYNEFCKLVQISLKPVETSQIC